MTAVAVVIPRVASADTVYWDGTNNALWSDATAWSTSSSATTPNPASIPGAVDDVWFNISTVNSALTAYLNGAQAANSLTFRSTGATSLLSGAAANSGIQTLSLGSGGVTVNAGAGATTLGSAANPIAFALTAAQTWANNSSNTLSAYGSFAGSAASGTQSFTIGGSGNTTLSGSISDGTAGGALGLVKVGSGTLTLQTGTTGANSSYTGGVWIQSGRLQLATGTSATQPAITTFDPLLGATPAVATPANIRIGDGATLGLDMAFGTSGSRSISTNRGIRIDGVGQIEFTGDQRSGRTFSYGGVIEGASSNDRLVLSTASTQPAQTNNAAFTATFSGNNTLSGGLLVTSRVQANTAPQSARWAVVLSGSNNFGTGVVIDGADVTPILRSGTAGALGQNISANNVTVNFGELSLASATALGSNQTVIVNGFSGVLNTVDLGYSGAVPTNIQWKSAYGGVVGVGATTFSQQLDMGALGSATDGSYGRLFLGVGQYGNGSAVKSGTYSAASLGFGADATYRLGGGGNSAQPPVLSFANSVLTGANNVLIGRNAAFNGAADIRLNVANTYSGWTTIDQGVLTLTTATGAIPNTSAITINTGGTLKLDNTSTANNTNRIGDSTPVSINGGTLNFSNNAGSANYSESLGALTLGMGRAAITTSQAASGQTSTLTFASVARNAGSAVVVNGTSVGADSRNRIVFTNPSGLKDFAGNAIAGGSIIPWAVNGFSGTANGFMTHESGTLQAYAYTAAETKTGTSGWTNDSGQVIASTANLRWLPGVTGANATLTVPSGTTAINSLSYYGTGASVPNPANLTISGAADRLVITSGGIYSYSSDSNRGMAIGGSGSLTAGTGVTEMIFATANATAINVPIVDPDGSTRMGVTIAGAGVAFGNVNAYSGNTVIANGGSLRPTTTNALPYGSGKGDVYVYGTLGADGVSSNSGFTINGLWGNGSVVAITGGLTVGANNASSQFDGIFPQATSNGAMGASPLTKIGTGTLTLTGMSPLTLGTFTVREGVLAVTSVRDGGYASAIGAHSVAASNLILADSTSNATLRYVGQDANSTNRLFTVGGTSAGVTATIDASGSTPTASSGVDSRATIAFTNTGAIAYGNANQTRTLRFAGTNTGTNSFAPQINNNGTGVVSVVKDGVGLWVLSGSNTYTGTTAVQAGVLRFSSLASGASAQNLGSGSVVNLGVAATSAGELDYAGSGGTLDKNVFALGTGRNRVRNSGAGTLELSGTLTKNGTILELAGGTFSVTGQITGSSANSDLYVNGASVTLSNTNNNYNGPTYVYGNGTLSLGASNVIPNGSDLILGGTGSDAGTGAFTVGSYSDTIASLTTSSQGSTVSISLSGGSGGSLTSNGNLTFGSGTDTLALSLSSLTAGRYQLISYAGTRSGTFDTVTYTGSDSRYNLVYGGTSNSSIDLQMRATQAATLPYAQPTSGTVSAFVSTNVAFSGTLANTTPEGGAALVVSLGGNGGQLTVGSLAASTGSTVAAGLGATITGQIATGTTLGSRSWTVVNTDTSALTSTTATASGVVNVFAHGTPTLSGTTINLGNVLVGATASQLLTLSNGVVGSPAANTGGITWMASSTPSGFGTGGSNQAGVVASGAGVNYTYGLVTGSAGNFSGSQTFTFADDTSILGGGSLGGLTVSLTGAVYDPATASLASGGAMAGNAWTINLGEFNQGAGTSTPWNFSISNLLASGSFTADLMLNSFALTGDSGAIFMDLTGTSSFQTLQPSGTNQFTAWMSLANTGMFTNTYQLNFTSAKDNQVLGGSQNVTLTVTGIIVVPEPAALALAGIGIAMAGWSLWKRHRRS